jgi:predicted permease
MANWQTVLVKIAAMFLVIVVGWAARRRGYLAAATTTVLGRFVVDVALPALAFTEMLHSVTLGALREGWFDPLLSVVLILIAWIPGLLLAPLFSRGAQRKTFVFLVSIPNWLFLPLPIVDAMYGAAGIRTLFLYNVGAQLMLWTFGVWILHGGVTAAGIIVALLVPTSSQWETMSGTTGTPLHLLAAAVVQAMAMVGSLTIPVSLLAIGAQLGDLELYVHRPSRALWGVLVVRLIVGPVLTAFVGWAVLRAGVHIPEIPRMIAYLTATMPVAISCSVFTERFGGDVSLGAQGIFYSTFFSLLTVPVIFFLVQRLGL